MPTTRRVLTALAAAAILLAGAPLHAQPGFGPPKSSRPKKPAPAPAAPTGDKKPEPAPDAPDDTGGPGPDAPEARSPMFEPSGAPKFVPSPEEWLESDPPRHAPASDLTPGATYAWRSTDGLRFTYTIPVEFNPKEGADVIIICHPSGHDFRWGTGNHPSLKAAEERGSASLAFRPRDIVVSVDGIGAEARQPGRRWFPSDSAAAVRFRDFVLELTRTLPARRFYLYGVGGGDEETGGGGGQFALFFARSFPALADGVIAYGANLPPGTATKSNIPIVFVHGVKNGLVPFADALKAADAYREADHKLVRVRALRGFNDYPNPVRVAECIDYLTGARTDKPAEALAAAESMLTPKPGDEYDYLCPVWYAGAREVLARILGEPGPLTGEAPLEGKSAPSPEIKDRAREIVKLLDAEAAANVAALREFIPESAKAADLVLDGRPWLGHLIAARDDFRGVKPMEDFAAAIGFDDAARRHAASAEALAAEWTTRADEENFALVASTLPKCFLSEGLPVDLSAKMKSWKRKHDAGELELPADALEGFENVANWDEGYRKGLDAYRRVWRDWSFKPAARAAPPATPTPVAAPTPP